MRLPLTSRPVYGYLTALLACGIITLINILLTDYFELANIVLLYLFGVFLIAWGYGRGPASVAAVISVGLLDFFFVSPRFSFAVGDLQYLLTFSVMLAVGLLTAHLTAKLHHQARLASNSEAQTQRLYELARALAGAISLPQVSTALNHYLAGSTYTASLHLLDKHDHLGEVSTDYINMQLARTAFESGEVIHSELEADRGVSQVYIPLKAPMRIRGVMLLTGRNIRLNPTQPEREVLVTVASLIAIAVERLHFIEVAHQTQLQVVTERLRSSILAALSHDIRTPLTSLVGLADSLVLSKETMSDFSRSTAVVIRDQAKAMSHLLGNLLDMARLHAGNVRLRQEWQLYEDVIASSLQLLKPSLAAHTIKVHLEPGLPLVQFDAVLLERVVCNLVENAAKYAPATTVIEVRAYTTPSHACVSVRDQGPGFPSDKMTRVFEMFVRGTSESSTAGVGLGLAICKAIIEAHQGFIGAENCAGGGGCISFGLPRGTPPRIEPEVIG
ncbi:MAG: DUF4118 domain-containing protein [Gammaproteobacteria bacterium]|nr:DUF4118 domain-containing protein [Gammaproteobacteria bacterium]